MNRVLGCLAFCLTGCTSGHLKPVRFYAPPECRNQLSFENGLFVQNERVFTKGKETVLSRTLSKASGMQRPDLSSLRDRLAGGAWRSLLEVIAPDDLPSMRSVVVSFDVMGQVQFMNFEFFMKHGMGCLEFKKTSTDTTTLAWHELARDGNDESVSIPRAGAVLELSCQSMPITIFHDASLTAKIFNPGNLPTQWNVTHFKNAGLHKTIVRIQPDYGCEEHRIDHPYSTQWMFEKEAMHLIYLQPSGKVEADLWILP